MEVSGVLRKMRTDIGNPIQYYITMEEGEHKVNEWIGHELTLTFDGMECLCCGAERKIYRQGFCYKCFYDSPAVGDWIMRPELSKAHLDIEDRDLAYEKSVQLAPHIVYLALSSDVKVGVTRKTQVPTRWIDQGANAAIEIVEVPNRYLAGITEVALKAFFADKTNWRKMLKNEVSEADLLEQKLSVYDKLPEEVLPYFLHDNAVLDIEYPVTQYPLKVKSLNLEKTPSFTGKLVGVKGQYFIFDDNTVFNVRSNEGKKVIVNVS